MANKDTVDKDLEQILAIIDKERSRYKIAVAFKALLEARLLAELWELATARPPYDDPIDKIYKKIKALEDNKPKVENARICYTDSRAKDSKTIRDLLDDFRLFHDVTCSDDVTEQTEITKAKLNDYYLSLLEGAEIEWMRHYDEFKFDPSPATFKRLHNASIEEIRERIKGEK